MKTPRSRKAISLILSASLLASTPIYSADGPMQTIKSGFFSSLAVLKGVMNKAKDGTIAAWNGVYKFFVKEKPEKQSFISKNLLFKTPGTKRKVLGERLALVVENGIFALILLYFLGRYLNSQKGPFWNGIKRRYNDMVEYVKGKIEAIQERLKREKVEPTDEDEKDEGETVVEDTISEDIGEISESVVEDTLNSEDIDEISEPVKKRRVRRKKVRREEEVEGLDELKSNVEGSDTTFWQKVRKAPKAAGEKVGSAFKITWKWLLREIYALWEYAVWHGKKIKNARNRANAWVEEEEYVKPTKQDIENLQEENLRMQENIEYLKEALYGLRQASAVSGVKEVDTIPQMDDETFVEETYPLDPAPLPKRPANSLNTLKNQNREQVLELAKKFGHTTAEDKPDATVAEEEEEEEVAKVAASIAAAEAAKEDEETEDE